MIVETEIGGLIYRISSEGRIYKRRGKGFLKTWPDKDGYLRVSITTKQGTVNKSLHRVIWKAFNGEIPDDMTVDHIDNNKLNNKLKNFQLLSRGDNSIEANARHWTVISPDGEVFKVYNLRKFCRDFNLHQGHLYVHRKHKKWRLE